MLDNDGKKFFEMTFFRNRVFNLTSCHSQASLPSIGGFINYLEPFFEFSYPSQFEKIF